MSGFAYGAFLLGLVVTLVVNVAGYIVVWLVGRSLGRYNVVDAWWGPSFAVIAMTALIVSLGQHTDTTRRLLELGMVCVWAARLGIFIGRRSVGKGEDPRYDELLGRAGGSRDTAALTRIFLTQAAVSWFVSLPVQAAMFERTPVNVVGILGLLLWLVGVGFEAVGDAQMGAFRRNPANKGQVMDRGLWHYTRHPNYFGEACLWTGLWLVSAQHWVGLATVLSPVAMTWFVAFKTGKPLLEESMRRNKPGYADYMDRTSGFFPLPPRRPARSS